MASELNDIGPLLKGAGILYVHEKNPLHVWFALKLCLKRNEPIPGWVRSYLLETAENLSKIDNPQKAAGKLVLNALGINDSRVFTRQHQLKSEIMVYFDVKILCEGPGSKKVCEALIDVAEKHNISTEKAKKTYYEWKKRFQNDKRINSSSFVSLGDAPQPGDS